MAFYHEEHGGDFSFNGMHEELVWIRDKIAGWFDVKVRGMLGRDEWGLEGNHCFESDYSVKGVGAGMGRRSEASEKILEYFDMDGDSRGGRTNFEKEGKKEDWEDVS